MNEKSLFVPAWVRAAIYFSLGYVGCSMTFLLGAIIFNGFYDPFWIFLGGVATSIFFLWEDRPGEEI